MLGRVKGFGSCAGLEFGMWGLMDGYFIQEMCLLSGDRFDLEGFGVGVGTGKSVARYP